MGSRFDVGPLASGAIDLGEIGQSMGDPTVPWRPDWLRHLAKAFVILAVAMLGLHASAAPVAGWLGDPLWTAPLEWDSFDFARGVIYTTEGPGGTTVVARAAESGEERWRRDYGQGPVHAIDVGAGVAAILPLPGGVPTGEPWSAALASAGTGELITKMSWPGSTFPAGAARTVTGLVLLFVYLNPGTGECPAAGGEGAGCTEVRAFSRAEPAWRLVTAPGDVLVSRYEGERLAGLATLAPDGVTQFYDLPTGLVVATMTVEPGVTSAVLMPETLVIMKVGPAEVTVTGYDTRSLERLWRTTTPPPAQHPPGTYLYGCGDLVCLARPSGTSLIDAATGRTRLSDGADVVNLGDGLIATIGEGQPPHTVDGLAVLQLPEANVITWAGVTGQALLTRAGSTATAILLAERTGATRLLGTVADPNWCIARADLLACAVGTQLRVWRLPL